MNDFTPEPLITRAFHHLRQEFDLGVSEYFAALDAVAAGMGADSVEDLRQVLRLLWCHSPDERRKFALLWEEIVPAPSSVPLASRQQSRPSELPTPTPPPSSVSSPSLPSPQPELPPPEPTSPKLSSLPIRTPTTVEIDNLPELYTYHPVTRRSMAYLWRYLRRPVADGPPDVLDVEATVDRVARDGVYLEPVYQRREVNRARLLLLIDQDGSMTPFHRFTRDLVDTVHAEGTLVEEGLKVVYFHNVPVEFLYWDDHLTQPVPLEQVLSDCDSDTSILIVSDAGAARGSRRQERVQKTVEFLLQLRQKSSLISWLNPVPISRWVRSSAELISYLVQMDQMDGDGMSHAIDVVRGQPLSHLHS